MVRFSCFAVYYCLPLVQSMFCMLEYALIMVMERASEFKAAHARFAAKLACIPSERGWKC